MAIPRGYRRGSGGFLQPVGSVRSGRVSGPRQGDLLGFRDASGKVTYRDTTKLKGAEQKVLASFEKAQKRHEGLMAGMAKAETDAFERINKALNESKESDPKDKLGNTVPSTQTKFLEQQLIGHLANKSQRGKRVTPGGAGVTPEQERTFAEEGPYIPGTPGSRDLLGRGPSPEPVTAGLRPPSVTPIAGEDWTHKSGDTVTVTGNTRQGPKGLEIEATVNGKTGWIPEGDIQPPEGDRAGGVPDLQGYFQRLLNPPETDFQPF